MAGVGTGGDATMTFRAALTRLREAQKTSKGVSLYSRYVNRPVGRVFAAAAYRAGRTPNQVTALSALVSFAGIAALALVPPSWPLALCVWAALVLGFALDAADGQLARLRGTSSPAGEWLDHAVDCAKITALHTAVLVTFHQHFALPGERWLLVPPVFQLAAVMIFFGGLLTDKLRPRPAAPPGAPAPAPSRLRAVALLPVDYGTMCALFLLLGDERLFRLGYALLACVYVLFCAAFSVKWFRELSAAGTAAGAASASSAARS
ncbi:CDP-alcohol phosphatidyltransferase family protein [Streptomyces avicenniae]|uniref:CDP-alcohol phosphatidyltransferase family protein n=1 Tax=Streptomyces avicenniae TaxID=500153 RepID=UPI000A906C30|nr:CDP-alcohol phosphatidyltransferase family protein [Streptomyces avicenniae]